MISNNWQNIYKSKNNFDNINNSSDIKVACILAYYDGQKYIRDQISSIVNQNTNNFSLTIFISDDCSNENFSSSFSFDFFNKTVSVDILNCSVPLSDDLPLFKINVIVPSGTINESGLFIPTEMGSSTSLEFTHLSISSLYDGSVFDLSNIEQDNINLENTIVSSMDISDNATHDI